MNENREELAAALRQAIDDPATQERARKAIEAMSRDERTHHLFLAQRSVLWRLLSRSQESPEIER